MGFLFHSFVMVIISQFRVLYFTRIFMMMMMMMMMMCIVPDRTYGMLQIRNKDDFA
jgi:hypothetical protein